MCILGVVSQISIVKCDIVRQARDITTQSVRTDLHVHNNYVVEYAQPSSQL